MLVPGSADVRHGRQALARHLPAARAVASGMYPASYGAQVRTSAEGHCLARRRALAAACRRRRGAAKTSQTVGTADTIACKAPVGKERHSGLGQGPGCRLRRQCTCAPVA